MKNPFKSKDKNTELLASLSASFAILTEFERKGVIHWDRKTRSLLLEQSIATVELALGEQGFRDFLDKVCIWQNFRLIQGAYDAKRIDLESKAVRNARLLNESLTDADIQRIRQNVRDTMEPISEEELSKSMIHEFELYIIRADVQSYRDAVESVSSGDTIGSLVAVGHWDGKTLEMAMYDDIKHNLNYE